MKTENEVLERMKLIEEIHILAAKVGAPTESFTLMLDVLDWVLEDQK